MTACGARALKAAQARCGRPGRVSKFALLAAHPAATELPDKVIDRFCSILPAVDARGRGDYKRRVGGEVLAAACFYGCLAARQCAGRSAARQRAEPCPRPLLPARQ